MVEAKKRDMERIRRKDKKVERKVWQHSKKPKVFYRILQLVSNEDMSQSTYYIQNKKGEVLSDR